MKRYDLITPEGTRDLLFEDCLARRKVEKTLAALFEGFGYSEVVTPGIEFYDAFSGVLQKYNFIPDNQQWYRDFVNKELAKYDKPTAREMIEDALKKKREKTYDKE